MKEKSFNVLKITISIILTVIFCIVSIIFGFKYVDISGYNFIIQYSKIIKIFSILSAFLISLTSLVLILKNKDAGFKIIIFCLFCIMIFLLFVYVLKITNFWDKVNDIDDLREYVSSFGAYAVIIFLLMQILQVVVLPIPGVVAIGAGVALFGVKLGAFYSLIGILLGSLIAYYIGKYPGEKVVGWLVGKKNLENTLKKVEGKDKLILTIMFLFPFFPDDVLCFIAGMSSMSQRYFIIMIIITRIIGVYTTAFSVNGSLIPYNTPWGIAIWAILIIGTFILTLIINKHGKTIEQKFKNVFTKKKNK